MEFRIRVVTTPRVITLETRPDDVDGECQLYRKSFGSWRSVIRTDYGRNHRPLLWKSICQTTCFSRRYTRPGSWAAALRPSSSSWTLIAPDTERFIGEPHPTIIVASASLAMRLSTQQTTVEALVPGARALAANIWKILLWANNTARKDGLTLRTLGQMQNDELEQST